MDSAAPAKQNSWDEIKIENEWVGLPPKKPNPVALGLRRNTTLVFICLLAFVVGAPFGFVFFDESSVILKPVLEGLEGLVSDSGSSFELALSIFINNFKASIILLFSGTLLIIPLLILMLNGLVVGFVLRAFLDEGYSLTSFFLALLPHGILEMPAFFLAAALGIRIGLSYVVPKGNIFSCVSENIKLAGAVYLAVVLPLLLAAAFVEAYVSAALVP